MNCNIETQVVFCCLSCRKIQRLCKARAEAKFTWIMPSRRQRCIYMNVCARREQKPSLLGLCRAAANFRASECNRACSYCRAQPKISKQIFVQASAEPNLFGLCRAQPKMSRNFRASECRAELVRAMPSAAENLKEKCQEKVHLYETFAHVPLYAIFPLKNPAYPSLTPYLLVYKYVASVWFAGPTLH